MPSAMLGLLHDVWMPILNLGYLLLLIVISIYGLHRYWLVLLYARHRRKAPKPPVRFAELPRITVQLPMFNEGAVAERVIDAACRLDYPADKLQVQVLDDSTDDSARIAQQRVAYWRRKGIDIDYIHRVDRRGYKAGALADALPAATGRFIAVFDADFVPPPHFLLDAIHHFTDPSIGMLQARWGHLNRESSLLTRAQAIFIDAHFAVEQAARNRSGRWFHFNGTAGIWRREAIDSAGGWSADTLCEDLDLSIRSQLAGWRFLYLQDLVCPAELPPVVPAFKQQQHRWFKGTTQVMLRLLPRVLRSREVSWKVKAELTCQLLAPWLCVALVLFSMAYYPAMAMAFLAGYPVAIGAVTLMTGLVAGTFFFCVGQYLVGRHPLYAMLMLPVLISAGMGIGLTNTRGIVEAMLGKRSAFIRTPKYNDTACGTVGRPPADARPLTTKASVAAWQWAWPMVEITLGVYLAFCVVWAAGASATITASPLLALFAIGYLWFGTASLLQTVRTAAAPQVHAAPAAAAPAPALSITRE